MTDTRTAVVTGAAKGVGAGIAKRLAADGFAVAAVDIHDTSCERVVAEIRSTGGRALALTVDVRDGAAVTAGVARVAAELGPPTVLVNSAGILQDNILFTMSGYELDEVLSLNMCGAFLMTRAVQGYMTQAGWGRIVNLFSTSDPSDGPRADNRSAEAGLNGFTASLATELGKFGVTVNAIAPGFVETEMTAATARWLSVLETDLKQRASAHSLVARTGAVEDVAHAVSFFVSEGAGLVSGEVLHVGGEAKGMTPVPEPGKSARPCGPTSQRARVMRGPARATHGGPRDDHR